MAKNWSEGAREVRSPRGTEISAKSWQTEAPLRIAKAGFEYAVSDFARTQSLYYGLTSVLLALFVGWLGRIVFRKD